MLFFIDIIRVLEYNGLWQFLLIIRGRGEALEYIDFVVETLGSLDDNTFEMLKKALVGEYLSFSVIKEDKVSKEVLSEKICDYFEKVTIKTGKSFDKHYQCVYKRYRLCCRK